MEGKINVDYKGNIKYSLQSRWGWGGGNPKLIKPGLGSHGVFAELHSGTPSCAATDGDAVFSSAPLRTGFPFSSPTSNNPIQGRAESAMRTSGWDRGGAGRGAGSCHNPTNSCGDGKASGWPRSGSQQHLDSSSPTHPCKVSVQYHTNGHRMMFANRFVGAAGCVSPLRAQP